MEISLRFVEARKRFIELCEIYGNKTPKQNMELNNLWDRKVTEYDTGDGEIAAKFVLELSAKLGAMSAKRRN